MTDARLPERWLNARKFRRLSDHEWRSYTHALMWSVANRTDGAIEHRDIEDIPGFDPACVPTFVDGDLWSRIDDGWLIADYLLTQSTKTELDADDRRRANDRERKRRERAAAKAAASEHVRADVPADVTRDPTGQDRTGQDRTGISRGTDRKNSDEQRENVQARTETNGEQPFTATSEQLARIDANVARGYES